MPKEVCSHSVCNKKLTLASIKCKCEKKFCDAHRPAEEHACAFDFRAEGKDILMRHMSTAIIGKKLEAI
jgi:predicted nucleic acid binding AN1-type Zn finger protein